jgi:hypothetical protein
MAVAQAVPRLKPSQPYRQSGGPVEKLFIFVDFRDHGARQIGYFKAIQERRTLAILAIWGG